MEKARLISSKMQITLIMLMVIIPLTAFLLVYNFYTIGVLNERLAKSGIDAISLYQKSMDENLKNIESLMVDIMANDSDFKQYVHAKSNTDRYMYSLNLIDKMKRFLANNSNIAAFSLYSTDSKMYRDIYSGVYKYKFKQAYTNFVKSLGETDESLTTKAWFIKEIDKRNMLVRVLKIRNTYVTCMYDLELSHKPEFMNSQNDALLFYTDKSPNVLTSRDFVAENEIEVKETPKEYYISGKKSEFIVVQNYLDYAGLNFVYASPYKGLFMGFDGTQLFLFFASILICCLMFLSFSFLQSMYFKPLEKLILTMKTIESGDVDLQMPTDHSIKEFNLFAGTFNNMMKQIKSLKISAYEYELQTQQAKLQYLQIQIRPHFFLNCLKNLYGLAQEKKYEYIQQTILALSSHLRYIFKDNFMLVDIKTELESVTNYISLQQMSASYLINCDIVLEKELESFQIPPLSILTFVENSVKHRGNERKNMLLNVKISKIEDFISIKIFDNGVGFSPEVLSKINSTGEFEYRENNIGIENIKHRCALIYNNKCTFLFSNITGGACVEIFIPLKKEE